MIEIFWKIKVGISFVGYLSVCSGLSNNVDGMLVPSSNPRCVIYLPTRLDVK